MTRTLVQIRDTGLNTPTEQTPTRIRAYSGDWLELYADRLTYNQNARLGESSQRQLEFQVNGPYRYDDVTHAGVENPSLVISGAVDTTLDAEKQHLKALYDMLASQGVKELEGDFLGLLDDGPVYVRLRNITLNPPNYGSGVNKVRYQVNLVRVR